MKATNMGKDCSLAERVNVADELDKIRSERFHKVQELNDREVVLDDLRKEHEDLKDQCLE